MDQPDTRNALSAQPVGGLVGGFDGDEAERLGIVNRVVAADGLKEAVDDWARRLAAKSPVLMKLGKDALWRQNDMALEDAWDYLRAQLTIAFATEDIQEGVPRSS